MRVLQQLIFVELFFPEVGIRARAKTFRVFLTVTQSRISPAPLILSDWSPEVCHQLSHPLRLRFLLGFFSGFPFHLHGNSAADGSSATYGVRRLESQSRGLPHKDDEHHLSEIRRPRRRRFSQDILVTFIRSIWQRAERERVHVQNWF